MLQLWAEDILRAEPAAIRAQKRLIETWLETAPAVGIQASIDAFSATFHAGSANDRLAAFLARRNKSASTDADTNPGEG